MKIKTRFAPSPTGYLHIGSARTALYSWLFARNHGGKFILRIEDTDTKRSTPKAIKAIINDIKWLKLNWDEGPYFQTKRLNRYNIVINEMLKSGKAYKCFCSKERLDLLRKKQIEKKEKPRYDSRCRYIHKFNINSNEPYVVRFANPKEGCVVFNDKIHGVIKFDNKELDDLVIRRNDGSPTYNFCSVIDDWDMNITHIIRGEDHINNTPRQINILKALNAPIPVYAHISMINGSDGKKLSKRHSAVSIMQYRNDGYLPESLLNYLLRLGWSNGNQEIFNLEEMIKLFSLDTVSKSSSILNTDKLMWLNHYYINNLPITYVASHLKWHISEAKINICNGPQLSELIKLLGRRHKTLKSIAENCRFLYEDFREFDVSAAEKYLIPISYKPLKTIFNKLIAIDSWTVDNIYYAIHATADELALKMHEVCMPLRVAITGTEKSPSIDVIVHAIGKNRSIDRINKALNFISEKEIITNK